MNRFAVHSVVVLALVGAVLACPVSAQASSCPDASVVPNFDRTGDGFAGICIDTGTGTPFEGGSVEVGNGANGSYVVIEGDDSNEGSGAGYVGLSTYENGDSDSSADGCETSSGDNNSTNSGGCLDVYGDGQPGVELPFSPLVCGNITGDWDETSTNGCSPNLDLFNP